jgi:type I restriction enzyme S subunit
MNAQWENKAIGEILRLEYGKPLDEVDRTPEGRFPVYGANGVKGRTDRAYHCKPSVIVGRKGSAGEINLADGPFWPLDVTYFTTFNEDRYDLRFLYYLLKTLDLPSLAKGVKPGINRSEVYSKAVAVPLLEEQQRIVGILDEALAGLATAKVNAEESLRKSDEIFASHRDEVLSGGKDGWSRGSLSDLCDIKHGYAFDGAFFSKAGEYVLLTPGNFYEAGGYRDRGDKQKFYVGEIPNGFVLNKGDLLVAMTEQAAGLLGSPLLVPESSRFLHNQRLGLVRPKPGVAWANEFFFHMFNTRRVRSEIHASASGVKVRHTSPGKIGDVVVNFPDDLSEQKRVASDLEAVQKESEQLVSVFQRKLAALDELKQSLLHRAFSGQL